MPHKTVATVFHREQLRKWDGSRGWVPDGFATCDVKVLIDEEKLAAKLAPRALKSPRRKVSVLNGALLLEVTNLRRTPPPEPTK